MTFIVVDFGSANSAQFDDAKAALDAACQDPDTGLAMLVTEGSTPNFPDLSLRQLLAQQGSTAMTLALSTAIEAAHAVSDHVVMARIPTTGGLSLVPSVSLEDLDINTIVIDPTEEDVKNQMMRLRMMFTDDTEVEQNVTASINLLHTWVTHYFSPGVGALLHLVEEEQQYITRAREDASTEVKGRFDELTMELADLMPALEALRSARDEVVTLVEEQAHQARADAAADQKHLERIVAAAEAEEADRETLEQLNTPSRVEAVQQCLHCIHERMLVLHTTTQEPMQRLALWARAAADAVHAHCPEASLSAQSEGEEEDGVQNGCKADASGGADAGQLAGETGEARDEDKNQGDKNGGGKERENEEQEATKECREEGTSAVDVTSCAATTTTTAVAAAAAEDEGEGEDGGVDGRPLSVVDHGHRRSSTAKERYALMASPVGACGARGTGDLEGDDTRDGPAFDEAAEAAHATTADASTTTASAAAVAAVAVGQQTEPKATADVGVQHQQEEVVPQQQQQAAAPGDLGMSASYMVASVSDADLRQKLGQCRARYQALKKELARTRTTAQQAQKERDDARAQLRITEDKLRAARSKRSAAPMPTDPKMLKEQEELLASLREDLAAARAGMKDVCGHRDAIATERDTLTEEKLKLAHEAKQQAVRVSELQAHVGSLEEQLSMCREHLQKEQEQTQAQALAEDKATEEEANRLRAEMRALQASVTRAQTLNAELREQFEGLRETHSKTVEELESVRTQVKQLHTERATLKQQAEKAGKGMGDLRDLVEKMEHEMNSLRHENTKLKDQSAQASSELAEAKQQLQKKEEEKEGETEEEKEEQKQAVEGSTGSEDVVTIPKSEYQKLRSAADGAEVMRVMAEEASTNTEQLESALESVRSELAAVRQETAALQAKVRDRDDTIGRLIEQKEMLEQLVHSREQDSLAPRPGTLRLVMEGEIEDGDVILIERRPDGAWVRQNDTSVVVMDEYVTSLDLNGPSTPSPLPVQVLMIHDFGHTKGIEITRYLREV